MSLATSHAADRADRSGDSWAAGPTGYIPGVCNIGPDELRARKIAAAAMILLTLAAFAVLLWARVSPLWHLALGVPAMAAAVTALQVRYRFCVNFGARGVFNFGRIGTTEAVEDAEARRRDRARVRQMMLTALPVAIAFALAATAVAALLAG